MNHKKHPPAVEVERFHPDNTIASSGWIWVFGSNLAGRHGAGSAAIAHVNFRAHYGVGEGATGRSYAIPTKDRHLRVIPLDAVSNSVKGFIDYATANPATKFYVTRVGCGLAGYKDEQIAPMFKDAPLNCCLPDRWEQYICTLPAML